MHVTALARSVVKQYCRTPRIKLPIRLMEICVALGIDVRHVDLPAIDGCYIRRRPRMDFVILLNNSTHLHRKRFTLAHELGHILLGHRHAPLARRNVEHPHAAWQEAQANHFASELLMPAPILRQFGMLSPASISRIFATSLEAAEIKARQLGWTAEVRRRYNRELVERQLDDIFG